jgi:hypothetical protein
LNYYFEFAKFAALMEVFTFYSEYMDIKVFHECEFMQQFNTELNFDFDPPYLEVTIPSNRKEELLTKSKLFVLDDKSIFRPSTKIGIPCKGTSFEDEEIQKILDEHDCLSFSLCNGYILLDMEFEY